MGVGNNSGAAISRRRLLGQGVTLAAGAALCARATAFGQVASADVVLRGGRVLTLAGERSADAVAIRGGRIVYVGTNQGAQALAGAATEVIDVGGRTVMPGIHDGHTHPLAGGLALTKPTLNYRQLNKRQFVEAIRRLLERTKDQEPDGWLSVDLWDATAMDEQPTKEDLDQLATSRPIIVIALDGHIALANSRALAIAGITASTPDPPGGTIRRERGREPTGILLDDAIGLVLEKVPPLTPEQNAAALRAGHQAIVEQGITSYLDASTGRTELAALAALSDQGALNLRPSAAITVSARRAADPPELLAPPRAAPRHLRPS